MSIPGIRTRAVAIFGVAICTALGLAACGSSSSSGGGTNSGSGTNSAGAGAAANGAAFNTSHCPGSASTVPSGKTIVLGSSGPLSGPVAVDSAIYQGVRAYFDYVNSQGGVQTAAGKKLIKLDLLDDAFVPSKTLQNVQQLVQQDNVFAIANATGSPQNLAIAPFLTAQCVPQLFAEGAQGALGASQYPFGSNAFPNLDQDGLVIGRYLKSIAPHATVAVLYENDDFGQPILQGLQQALAGSSVKIVATQSFETNAVDVTNQMTTLAASKAQYFVSGSLGLDCTQSFKYIANSGWKPVKSFVTDACGAANLESVPAAVSSRIIGANILKGITGPTYLNSPDVKLYRSWLAKAGGTVGPSSEYGWYGASLTVAALHGAKTLTRIGVAQAAGDFAAMTPGVMLPGVTVRGWMNGTPVIPKIAMLPFNPATKDFGAPISVENALPAS